MAASTVVAHVMPVEVGIEARQVHSHFARVFGDEAVLVAPGHSKINNAELDRTQKDLNKNNDTPT
jgi:hypothetical protein